MAGLDFGVPMGGEEMGNLPSPLSGQTLKSWNTTANATLYTVPAGKKVYITMVLVAYTGAADNAQLKKGAAVMCTLTAGGDAGTAVANFSTPLLFNAGDTIVSSSVAGGKDMTVCGWEESK